jgi:hypothetical protein
MRRDRIALGASANVPDVRRRALLRLVVQPTCVEACRQQRSSGHRGRREGERWLYCYADDAFAEY